MVGQKQGKMDPRKEKKVTGPYQDKLHPVPKVQFFEKISIIIVEKVWYFSWFFQFSPPSKRIVIEKDALVLNGLTCVNKGWRYFLEILV